MYKASTQSSLSADRGMTIVNFERLPRVLCPAVIVGIMRITAYVPIVVLGVTTGRRVELEVVVAGK